MSYSFKDFTGHSMVLKTDLNGQTIRGSCFSREIPDSEVFPPDMKGVTFINCNLDNVTIPDGNTVTDCSQRRFKVQNDMNDWEIDDNNIPLNVMNWIHFYKNGLVHPSPAQIPDKPVSERIDFESLQPRKK